MDPAADRSARGEATLQEVLGVTGCAAATPFTEAARDFLFAEVWARPGLDRRSRRWITLACVCAAGSQIGMRAYLQAALDSGDITLGELREFVLQFAAFQGFPKAAEVETVLNQIVAARGSEQV